ncbi:MAG: leucine-rich repeat domain-containing protein [Bacteroides oleiciplenus]|nr:leucine-rich repeat domain-containing protein [Bacteroides oleiciplenus]
MPLLATGCDHEQDPAPAQKQSVDFTRITTRTADGTVLPGDFADYGILHAAISSGDGTPKTATLTYNRSSTTWTCSPELYWPSVTRNTLTLWRGSEGDFTLPADLGATASTTSGVSGSSVTNYALNDRLWLSYTGPIPSAPASPWQLEHRMAQMRVELTTASGVTLPGNVSLATATVSMTLPTEGTFSTTTGSVSRRQGSTAKGRVQFYQPNSAEAVFYAVALPGATGTREIIITLPGGQAYHYLASSFISLTAGSCLSYKLALTDRMDVQPLSVKTEGEWQGTTVGIGAMGDKEYACTTTTAGELATALSALVVNPYEKVTIKAGGMNDNDWTALTMFMNEKQYKEHPIELILDYTGSDELDVKLNSNIRVHSLTLKGKLKIMNNGFYNNTYLTSVKLQEGLTTLGESAFRDCVNLKSIAIPTTITTWNINTFKGTGLTLVTLAEGLTMLGESAFENCASLTGTVTIPSTITSFGKYAFKGSGLTSVVLTNGLTTLGESAFENCASLTGTVTIPSSIKSFGRYAFKGSGLTSVVLTNGLTMLSESAFENCTSLTGTVTIPSSITSFGKSAFKGTGLTSVVLPDKLTTLGESAFENCASLTGTVTIPSTITSFGKSAFKGTGLTSVVLSNKLTTLGESAFENCASLTGTVTIPSTITSFGMYAFRNSGVTKAVFGSGLTEIVRGLFDGCHTLKEVVIPNSVTSLKEYCFRNTSLTSVTLPSNLVGIGQEAFCGCASLTGAVILPPTVTSLDNGAFKGTGLTSVTLPNGLTTIGESAFENCTGLTGITIPAAVTSLGNGAFRASGLKSLTLPDKLKTLGWYTFANCANLTGEVIIPSSVKEIGHYAFGGSGLESVIIRCTNITWGGGMINRCFEDCANLKTAVVGELYPDYELYPGIQDGAQQFFNDNGKKAPLNAEIFLYNENIRDESWAIQWQSFHGMNWAKVHYKFQGVASILNDIKDPSRYKNTYSRPATP